MSHVSFLYTLSLFSLKVFGCVSYGKSRGTTLGRLFVDPD